MNVGNLPAVQNVAGTVSVGSGTVTANPGLPGAPFAVSSAGPGDSTNTAIPTGETLVVQTVSVQIQVLSGYATGADLEWTTGSNTSDLFIPVTYQYSLGGDDYYAGTLQVQLYASSGSVLNLIAETTSPSSDNITQLSVSGYTVS